MRITFRLELEVIYDMPEGDDDEILSDMVSDIRSQLLHHGSAAQIRGMLDTDHATAIIVVPGVEELS